jgi:hypothetical protein
MEPNFGVLRINARKFARMWRLEFIGRPEKKIFRPCNHHRRMASGKQSTSPRSVGEVALIRHTTSHYSPVLIAPLSNQFPRAGVQKKKSASPARRPADFRRLVAEDVVKWAKVVKFAGIKPD